MDLTGWPRGMRVIVRKERPHPARNGASTTSTTSTGCVSPRYRPHRSRLNDSQNDHPGHGTGAHPNDTGDIVIPSWQNHAATQARRQAAHTLWIPPDCDEPSKVRRAPDSVRSPPTDR